MLTPVQHLYRMLLRFEYSVSRYEALIQQDPVRFSKLQIPLRDSMEKAKTIEIILSNHPDSPVTEAERLQLKRYIINNELKRAEGGLCLGCAYYLSNRLRAEHGYLGMIKKLENVKKNAVACIPSGNRLSQATLSSCEMYAKDVNALPDDDLKEPEDRIAVWLYLQAKYEKAVQPENPERIHKE